MDSSDHMKSERKVRFTLPSETELDRENAFKGRNIKQKKMPIPDLNIREPRLDERKVHGTARYINGTLNFCSTDYKSIHKQPNEQKKDDHHKFKPKLPSCLTPSKKKPVEEIVTGDACIKSSISNASDSHSSSYKKDTVPAFSALVPVNQNGSVAKKTSNIKSARRSPRRRFIFFSPSFIKRKTPGGGICCTPTRRKHKITDHIPNTLHVPAFTGMQKLRYQLYTNHENSKHNLINMQLKQLHLQQSEENGKRTDDKQSLLIIDGSTDDDDDDDDYDVDHAKGIDSNAQSTTSQAKASPTTAALEIKYSRDNSLSSFHEFVQRWRRVQSKSLAKVNQWKWKYRAAAASVDTRGFKNSDVKFSLSKMCSTASPSTGKHRFTVTNAPKSMPLITTLLRASRNQDEELIKNVLQHIVTEGISVDDLNATDASGRTAISYICSTNVTEFLELLLHTPGIDINKPDVELNSPLHHAAESGQVGAVKLLLSESKVQIDSKNVFGFTPLMKAAIQGHVRCSKMLLFAGASPIVTDYGRGLRAEQWARFCGRHSCAEIIEKCSRTSVYDKDKDAMKCDGGSGKDKLIKGRARANSTVPTTSKIPPLGISNNNNSNGGIRSKLSKVFNFSRDKSTSYTSHSSPGSRKNSSDFESSTSEVASISGSAPGSYSPYNARNDSKWGRSFVRPLEVPKLEITSPHNQDLIKKYENRYNPPVDESSKPPALPPRRGSKIVL